MIHALNKNMVCFSARKPAKKMKNGNPRAGYPRKLKGSRAQNENMGDKQPTKKKPLNAVHST